MLDIRTVGLTVGIDLASKPDAVGKRGFEALELASTSRSSCSARVGDTLALSPPLIVSEAQIGEIFDKVGKHHQGGGVSPLIPRRRRSRAYADQ